MRKKHLFGAVLAVGGLFACCAMLGCDPSSEMDIAKHVITRLFMVEITYILGRFILAPFRYINYQNFNGCMGSNGICRIWQVLLPAQVAPCNRCEHWTAPAVR